MLSLVDSPEVFPPSSCFAFRARPWNPPAASRSRFLETMRASFLPFAWRRMLGECSFQNRNLFLPAYTALRLPTHLPARCRLDARRRRGVPRRASPPHRHPEKDFVFLEGGFRKRDAGGRPAADAVASRGTGVPRS